MAKIMYRPRKISKPIVKSEFLQIITEIYSAYKTNTHKASSEDCGLCRKYMVGYRFSDDRCKACPMVIFGRYASYAFYPCLERLCSPVDATISGMFDIEKDLMLVTEFYAVLIQEVKAMPEKGFTRTALYKVLKRVDKEVYNKLK